MSFRKLSRPRMLNPDVTQNSDVGGASFQIKTANTYSQRQGEWSQNESSGYTVSGHVVRELVRLPGFYGAQSIDRQWPYPQHYSKQRKDQYDSYENDENSFSTESVKNSGTKDISVHHSRGEVTHRHRSGTSKSRDAGLQGVTQESGFDFEKDIYKPDSLRMERIFEGGVDKVLNWFGLIKNSDHHTSAVLFRVKGIMDSMVTRDGMQIMLLRGKEHVLQCVYYIIDRIFSDIPSSSSVLVIGKMVGARKLIAHDIVKLNEDSSTSERISYLSDRAVNEFISLPMPSG